MLSHNINAYGAGGGWSNGGWYNGGWSNGGGYNYYPYTQTVNAVSPASTGTNGSLVIQTAWLDATRTRLNVTVAFRGVVIATGTMVGNSYTTGTPGYNGNGGAYYYRPFSKNVR
ncbi:MAG: hypothetical protein HC888_11340 [Candidatus Competibacteraceae bacterium]|nr:hypothetical protein [Candidatus Competibacteraceae bacterium]